MLAVVYRWFFARS